jgi:hypothetical protein
MLTCGVRPARSSTKAKHDPLSGTGEAVIHFSELGFVIRLETKEESGTGLLQTRRWRKGDSNPRSPAGGKDERAECHIFKRSASQAE